MGDQKTAKRPTRKLRDRKERKLYAEDWVLGDEEIEGRRAFRLEDKIETERFAHHHVKEMNGAELTLAHIQRHGFSTPILFREKTGLGLRVPSANFTVTDVRMCVGSRRALDVMDVNTQKNVEMTMKEWERYYNDTDKDKLLNVISLEFSHTKLENYVQTPAIVRQIDWVDCVWPRHLKDSQVESTNAIDDMMYPKVQKYCLMSVKGCYTDFHIDFGGTSVWYHILKGSKIFWLIQPTEHNMALYEQWVLSGKQSDVFFGDTVDRCGRITLMAGNTFFIPTGWIHAVYTPVDSLVFGGNFLHSFGIEKQLKVAEVEDATHVPQKFRYPFFTEMLWYVLERYVHCLLGRSHLSAPAPSPPPPATTHAHLTPQELHGLKAIIMYLHSLPTNKKNVPELLRDPIALIRDVRSLVEQHRHDTLEASVTGVSILRCDAEAERRRVPLAKNSGNRSATPHKLKMGKERPPKGSTRGGPRRRRTRCKKCEACQRSDCGECTFCQDMVKFGGLGRAKQTCIMRQCLQPMLPVTAACNGCRLDGWGQAPVIPIQKSSRDVPSSLMECSVCYEIIHPECVAKTCPGTEGVVNEDLPNSWECPKCCKEGKNVEYRPRHFRARNKSTDARRVSISSDGSSDAGGSSPPPVKRPRPEAGASEAPDRKPALRTALALQLSAASSRQLKRPAFPVRPAVVSRPSQQQGKLPGAMDKACVLPVMRMLTPAQLAACARVCKTWYNLSLDPSLWRRMDLSHVRLTATHLAGIVKRQPEALVLDWTGVAKRQLFWLVGRLTQMRELSLQGCTASGVSALRTCVCPPLHSLDLSFVSGLSDGSLRDVLSPPPDSRPGLVDTACRLRSLRSLRMAGCADVTDVALRYVAQHLPRVGLLDVSSCARVTDAGVAQLAALRQLHTLDLSNCRLLTDASLEHLARCDSLTRLDLRHTPHVTAAAIAKFAVRSRHELRVMDGKLIGKRTP